ncbi:MAG TPA: hypothetical protein VKU03_09750 [Roseiarcus sp.]|nr:hypothetical protein [Roseiarcus sp.]
MSSRIRFATARAVFEAFPDLRRLAPPPADDLPALDYARRLLALRKKSALAYLAFLLPRREAVWWALQCVAALSPRDAEDAALQAAEAWVRAPEEERRRAALDIGQTADRRRPSTWLAWAAARSGGSMTAPDQKPQPAQPSSCARAANAAVILAACAGDAQAIPQRLQACAEAGIRFAEGGDARPTIAARPGGKGR